MIVKDYKVSYAPFSATVPTTEFKGLTDCIRKLPNFFPDPENVDNSLVTNHTKTSEPGVSGGEALAFTAKVTEAMLDAHAEMVIEQEDSAKGYFWMKIEYPNRGKQVIFPAKTVQYLPTPEGELGTLDEITWNFYAQADIDETDITPAQG